MNRRRIGGYAASGLQEQQERFTPLPRLRSSAIRALSKAVAIPSFCFESKRASSQLAGLQRFDSKRNVESDDVYKRFDSKQKASSDYGRSFSEQFMDAQAESRPYCAQRKGEMLMLS